MLSCFDCVLFCKLTVFFVLFFIQIKITQLQFEINWKAQWKNMIFENG